MVQISPNMNMGAWEEGDKKAVVAVLEMLIQVCPFSRENRTDR